MWRICGKQNKPHSIYPSDIHPHIDIMSATPTVNTPETPLSEIDMDSSDGWSDSDDEEEQNAVPQGRAPDMGAVRTVTHAAVQKSKYKIKVEHFVTMNDGQGLSSEMNHIEKSSHPSFCPKRS